MRLNKLAVIWFKEVSIVALAATAVLRSYLVSTLTLSMRLPSIALTVKVMP